jgi:hypothetical protein
MKLFLLRKICVATTAVLAFKTSALAVAVYDNSTVDTGQDLAFHDGQTIGNQITLAGSGPYMLTDFSFEYYTPQLSFFGPVTADVRFYLNNGAPANGFATPGTVFYDSGSFNLEPAYTASGFDVATIDFANILYPGPYSPNNPASPVSVPVPDSFTFTISLSGVGTNNIGAELFSPATVGGNDGAYWYNNGSGWNLLTNSTGGASTIGARLSAVPTPDRASTLFLGIIGMSSLFGVSKLRIFKPTKAQKQF